MTDHDDPRIELTDRMRVAIDLAEWNVGERTGGPFGAAVYARDTGQLIACGVNLVVERGCSIAHAEMVALSLAQLRLETHDLGRPELPPLELVTSCEPCAMCFGAVVWSGIRRLVCGATAEDARTIGFDEGPRHPDWIAELERRDIEVVTGVLRHEAREVLRRYGETGGIIYNPYRA